MEDTANVSMDANAVMMAETTTKVKRARHSDLPNVKSKKLYALATHRATGVEHVLISEGAARVWVPLTECSRWRSRGGGVYYARGATRVVHGFAPKLDE